jgi:Fe-S-cluster containining protein
MVYYKLGCIMSGLNLNDFYNQIKELAASTPVSLTPDKTASVMANILKIAEEKVASAVTDEELKHMACHKGCSTCCQVNVAVLPPEAVSIAEFLREKLSPGEIQELREKMHSLLNEIKYLTDDERLFVNKKCAFLTDAGSCGIYPVRPLLCRSVTSADAEACRAAITMVALDRGVMVPMNISQKTIMDSAFKAAAEGLEAAGINSASREITDAVADLL